MEEAIPNYYHKFHCIAGLCQHSCCIGWEIDIDDETMMLYEALPGAFGERIRKSIEGDVPHFILGPGDRCPFLNEKGLCDIICEYGEEALCDICSLHPRFRNFYNSFVETGLGLCCEEAARTVLSETKKFTVLIPEKVSFTEEETVFLAKRQEIFEILQDRRNSIGKRFSTLAERFGFVFDFSMEKLCELYISLERLDNGWTKILDSIQGFSFDKRIFEAETFQIFFEQLAVYFVFRHLSDALWDGDYQERVRFVLASCYFIGSVCSYFQSSAEEITFDKAADIVRMYSAEIEYSEENVERLMETLGNS